MTRKFVKRSIFKKKKKKKNKGRMDENRKTVNSSGKLRRKEIRIKTQLEKR